jgi:hypothetical protein
VTIQINSNIQFFEGNEAKIIARPVQSSVDPTTGDIEYTPVSGLSLLMVVSDASDVPIPGLDNIVFIEPSTGVYQAVVDGSLLPAKGVQVIATITETTIYASKVKYRGERIIQERRL